MKPLLIIKSLNQRLAHLEAIMVRPDWSDYYRLDMMHKDPTCDVCHQDMTPLEHQRNRLARLPCGHVFHADCIARLHNCPACHKPFTRDEIITSQNPLPKPVLEQNRKLIETIITSHPLDKTRYKFWDMYSGFAKTAFWFVNRERHKTYSVKPSDEIPGLLMCNHEMMSIKTWETIWFMPKYESVTQLPKYMQDIAAKLDLDPSDSDSEPSTPPRKLDPDSFPDPPTLPPRQQRWADDFDQPDSFPDQPTPPVRKLDPDSFPPPPVFPPRQQSWADDFDQPSSLPTEFDQYSGKTPFRPSSNKPFRPRAYKPFQPSSNKPFQPREYKPFQPSNKPHDPTVINKGKSFYNTHFQQNNKENVENTQYIPKTPFVKKGRDFFQKYRL
jgi:hypothetical protein